MVVFSLEHSDKNLFQFSVLDDNGRNVILGVIVSFANGRVTAVSPPIAIYRKNNKKALPEMRVNEALRVLLDAARQHGPMLFASEITPASLRQCWNDVCQRRVDPEVTAHPCYADMILVLKPREGVWVGQENGKLWFDRGMWDPFGTRNLQHDAVEKAVTPTADERATDNDPRTVYCLPYLDMTDNTISWFCWTQYAAAKAYFLQFRARPPSNPNRDTWIVSTTNLLENPGRPPMLLKLPQDKDSRASKK